MHLSISSKGNKIHTYIYERRIHTYVQKLSITVVTRQMFVPQEITATGCAEVPAMFLLDLLTLFLFYYNFYMNFRISLACLDLNLCLYFY